MVGGVFCGRRGIINGGLEWLFSSSGKRILIVGLLGLVI